MARPAPPHVRTPDAELLVCRRRRSGGPGRIVGPPVSAGQYVRVNLTRNAYLTRPKLDELAARLADAGRVDVVAGHPFLRRQVADYLDARGLPFVTWAPDPHTAGYGTGPPMPLDDEAWS